MEVAEINQAGRLMNGPCLYSHNITTTGWLVGRFLLVLLWLMSICPTSLVPSSHSLAEPHARKRNRSLRSLQLAAPALLTSWWQREAHNVSDT